MKLRQFAKKINFIKRVSGPENYYVGRPNITSTLSIIFNIIKILHSKVLTNNGPWVHRLESYLSNIHGGGEVIVVSNATLGLQLLAKALELKGEVIIPSFTFIATAHALMWQNITPVFCDIDEETHLINLGSAERCITPNTTAILAVHIWGQICNHKDLLALCKKHQIELIYDASHAFGCRNELYTISETGTASVVSMHATKIIHSLEGGFITTRNIELANKLKYMRNFGFTGYDEVKYLGINAKMNEISALIGLKNATNLAKIVKHNLTNYLEYEKVFESISGLKMLKYDSNHQNNFQYIVVRVDSIIFPLDRDEFVFLLHKRNIYVRKYFYPGCHQSPIYSKILPKVSLNTTNTVCSQIVIFPNGLSVSVKTVKTIRSLIEDILKNATAKS